MGSVLISLDKSSEALLRQLARVRYGGKKGAIRSVVVDGLHKLAEEDKRLKAVQRTIALMDKGLYDLKGKRPYKTRDEIYD